MRRPRSSNGPCTWTDREPPVGIRLTHTPGAPRSRSLACPEAKDHALGCRQRPCVCSPLRDGRPTIRARLGQYGRVATCTARSRRPAMSAAYRPRGGYAAWMYQRGTSGDAQVARDPLLRAHPASVWRVAIVVERDEHATRPNGCKHAFDRDDLLCARQLLHDLEREDEVERAAEHGVDLGIQHIADEEPFARDPSVQPLPRQVNQAGRDVEAGRARRRSHGWPQRASPSRPAILPVRTRIRGSPPAEPGACPTTIPGHHLDEELPIGRSVLRGARVLTPAISPWYRSTSDALPPRYVTSGPSRSQTGAVQRRRCGGLHQPESNAERGLWQPTEPLDRQRSILLEQLLPEDRIACVQSVAQARLMLAVQV